MRVKVKIVLALAMIVALAWTALHFVQAAAAEPLPQACQAGSYEIGRDDSNRPICKAEPTGCPYGDSIPLDSPKCAPSDTDINVGDKDTTPPDPDRPYYDAQGNKYDYRGNLIEAAQPEDAPASTCTGGK